MAELLRAHLALRPGEAARHHAVREYNEAGLEQLTVLLRKERTPVSGSAAFPRGLSLCYTAAVSAAAYNVWQLVPVPLPVLLCYQHTYSFVTCVTPIYLPLVFLFASCRPTLPSITRSTSAGRCGSSWLER